MLVRFRAKGLLVGFVRNQKCGTTTAMTYIGQALRGAPHDKTRDAKKFTKSLGRAEYCGEYGDFAEYEAELKECDVRIATYREPVAKLASGYRYCLKNNWLKCTFREFVNDYERHMGHQFVAQHCSTNTRRLGTDKGLYTHAIRNTDIDAELIPLLERLTGARPTPCRLRETTPAAISDDEHSMAREIMAVDYEVGWC